MVGKYLEGQPCSLLWTVRRHDVRTVTANTAELLTANYSEADARCLERVGALHRMARQVGVLVHLRVRELGRKRLGTAAKQV